MKSALFCGLLLLIVWTWIAHGITDALFVTSVILIGLGITKAIEEKINNDDSE